MAAPMQNLYDKQRQEATQRIGVQAQQGGDALKRRFASLGGLNSGAAIKAQQLNDDNAMQAKESAVAGINATQAQDEANRDMRREETQQAQSFQSGEAQKARDFTKAHNDMDRQFQEKVFAADQGSKLRQLDLADKTFAFQKDQAGFENQIKLSQDKKSGGLFGAGGFLGLGF